MATIRGCFLIDLSFCDDLEIVYCSFFRNIKDQFKKHRKCYTPELPDMLDKVVYTADIIMDLKKALLKIRKAYIPPDIPKLKVDS